MVERGPAGFAALAPAVAMPATPLIEGDTLGRMQRTLDSLARDYRERRRLGLGELLTPAIREGSDERLALALGLDEAPGRAPDEPSREAETRVTLKDVVSARVEVLEAAAMLALDRMPVLGNYSQQQAEFVALAVASAIQPRGADSLDDNLLDLPGGLTVPALLFAILVRYQNQR
jgi:hypothetical protein